MTGTSYVQVRWRAGVIVAASVALGSACGGGSPRSEVTPPPQPAAVGRNDRLVESVPVFPGARLEARNDLEPPRGGTGAGSYLYYRTDNPDRTAVVGHFKGHLRGWSVLKEEVHPSRHTVTFVRGDSWFQVSATDIADTARSNAPVPGYVLVVYADDAEAMTRSK